MDMVSFLIYDPETGEVVHTHVEPAALRASPKEALHHAAHDERRRLKVLRIDGVPTAPGIRVEQGKLVEVAEDSGAGGGATLAALEEPLDIERRYTRELGQRPQSPE